jgi:hypothetical protein
VQFSIAVSVSCRLAPAKPKVTSPLLADDDDGLFSAPAPKPAKPVEVHMHLSVYVNIILIWDINNSLLTTM